MPPGFLRLIAAQFFSALADNALLIVTIAWMQQRQMAAWLVPMLKVAFTLSYVLLAPLVGAVADAMPKARLMGWTNGLKLLGAASLLMGLHPVAGFVIVGLGAAAYAPAKYGLVTELVPPRQLVAANGWIEVSVVAAVLLGTGLGGLLVSASFGAAVRQWLALPGTTAALGLLLLIYAASGLLNRQLPDSGACYEAHPIHPRALTARFWQDLLRLWRDPGGGRLSMAATTLFWGVGAALQFIVLKWAETALGLPLSQAALMQAVVALGVVGGAVMAGRWVPLGRAHRMLPAGVALGLALPLLALVDHLWVAVPLLAAAGMVGGLMVVPLNALLQHRGCQLLTAGRSIAVQGFNEHLGILAMLGVYAGSVGAQVPVKAVMVVLGLAVAASLMRLMRSARALG